MNNYIDPTKPFGFEIDFLPVGEGERSGDAICMRWGYNLHSDYPEQFVMVVDGGFKETGDIVVDHIRDCYRTRTVNLMVNTHPHSDHIGGLHVVMDRLAVKSLWIHQPWNHHGLSDSFHDGRVTNRSIRQHLVEGLESAYELAKKAKEKGVFVWEPFTAPSGNPVCGVSISVFGPSREFYDSLLPGFAATPGSADPFGGKRIEYREWPLVDRWLNPLDENGATSAENNSSVVLHLRLPNYLGDVLLTGDAGIPALHGVSRAAQQFSIDLPRCLRLFQIPHHGSIQNLTPKILDILFGTRPQTILAGDFQRIAFASVSKDSDCMHPSKHVINALCDRNVQCVQTKGIPVSCQLGSVPHHIGDGKAAPLGPYPKVEKTYVNP